MTDQELREIGQGFIDRQKAMWEDTQRIERALSPKLAEKADAQWDFIDPLRMGVFLETMNADGCWSIDFSHIRKVCANPSAFKQQLDGERARAGDFNTLAVPEQELPAQEANDVPEQEQPEGVANTTTALDGFDHDEKGQAH